MPEAFVLHSGTVLVVVPTDTCKHKGFVRSVTLADVVLYKFLGLAVVVVAVAEVACELECLYFGHGFCVCCPGFRKGTCGRFITLCCLRRYGGLKSPCYPADATLISRTVVGTSNPREIQPRSPIGGIPAGGDFSGIGPKDRCLMCGNAGEKKAGSPCGAPCELSYFVQVLSKILSRLK